MPASVSTAQIQRSLDAGTVLLYHAILPDHLLIVAITRTAVKGYALPVPSQPLEREIQHFIRTVSKSPHFRTGQERQEVVRLGQQLYARLIAPVQAVLSEAQRVLLCPDGMQASCLGEHWWLGNAMARQSTGQSVWRCTLPHLWRSIAKRVAKVGA